MKNIKEPFGGVFQHLRKPKENTIYLIAQIIFLIMICLLHAAAAGHYADFYPINGTFQNFNPVRRLMSGQIPYKEFQDYLGIGHLYTGTMMTLLFGGTYRSSLMAYSFLSIFSLALILLMIFHAILYKKRIAFVLTNLVLIMLLTKPVFFSNLIVGTGEIGDALDYALGTGNSARFVRGMILPVSVALLRIAYKTYDMLEKRGKIPVKYGELIEICKIGMVAGFAFVWSNDYGINAWLVLCIMIFAAALTRTRKLGKSIAAAFVGGLVSVISIVLFIEIFTFGHLGNWLHSTLGTGGYQSWYYNSSKSFYLYDADFSYITLLQGLLSLVYLYKLWKARADRKSMARYGIPAFANLVCFCAVNEYRLLSGGSSREVALSVLFSTVFAEGFAAVKACFRLKAGMRRFFTYAVAITSSAWIVSALKDETVFWRLTEKEGEYLTSMGGNVRTLAEDLTETEQFLDGSSFFATYASAQEVMGDTFQPSGTDYIIHVLGDSQRKEYLEAFEKGGFEYTATIKNTYTHWEYWVERANWFFYRELYRNWHPVYSNTYETYWKRNEEEYRHTLSEECVIEIQDIDDSTKKIIVRADSNINGIADVYLDYEVRKRDTGQARLQLQRMLKIENTGTVYAPSSSSEMNYLRDSNKEYVPIVVVDGYGESTVTAMPFDSSSLFLYEAKCEDIYQVTFDYIEVSDMIDYKDKSVINVADSAKNRKMLEHASGIVIEDFKYPILDVRQEGKSLYIDIETNGIGVNKEGEILKKGNVLRLVR